MATSLYGACADPRMREKNYRLYLVPSLCDKDGSNSTACVQNQKFSVANGYLNYQAVKSPISRDSHDLKQNTQVANSLSRKDFDKMSKFDVSRKTKSEPNPSTRRVRSCNWTQENRVLRAKFGITKTRPDQSNATIIPQILLSVTRAMTLSSPVNSCRRTVVRRLLENERKTKLSAADLPRCYTPRNEHDPDRLNIKHVINILKSRRSGRQPAIESFMMKSPSKSDIQILSDDAERECSESKESCVSRKFPKSPAIYRLSRHRERTNKSMDEKIPSKSDEIGRIRLTRPIVKLNNEDRVNVTLGDLAQKYGSNGYTIIKHCSSPKVTSSFRLGSLQSYERLETGKITETFISKEKNHATITSSCSLGFPNSFRADVCNANESKNEGKNTVYLPRVTFNSEDDPVALKKESSNPIVLKVDTLNKDVDLFKLNLLKRTDVPKSKCKENLKADLNSVLTSVDENDRAYTCQRLLDVAIPTLCDSSEANSQHRYGAIKNAEVLLKLRHRHGE